MKEALADHPVSVDFYGFVNDRVAELLNEAAQRVEESQDCHVITFWHLKEYLHNEQHYARNDYPASEHHDNRSVPRASEISELYLKTKPSKRQKKRPV